MEEGIFGIGLVFFCFGLAYILVVVVVVVVCNYILNWQSYKKYGWPDSPQQDFLCDWSY